MRLAIVGSRNVNNIDIDSYVTNDVTEIVSGGAKGVDSIAAAYAKKKGIIFTEILPEYKLYGRAAPIVRNRTIVEYADKLIVFWDGRSRGSLYVIKYAKKIHKDIEVILCT